MEWEGGREGGREGGGQSAYLILFAGSFCVRNYSGAPLLWTPWGPGEV